MNKSSTTIKFNPSKLSNSKNNKKKSMKRRKKFLIKINKRIKRNTEKFSTKLNEN